MAVKVALEWLNACSGREISIMDMGERLIDVLDRIEFVHGPVLMDHKYATHGGIPALANSCRIDEILERCYSTETAYQPEKYPSKAVPSLHERCLALDEKIKVDMYLPGCPPHPDQVFSALLSLLAGKPADLSANSVCDFRPTVREGKGQVRQLRRFLQAPHYSAHGEPLDKMRCIAARAPCRGSYGPIGKKGDQRFDMRNALASNGIDIESLLESVSLPRFSGARGLLRPSRKGKEA